MALFDKLFPPPRPDKFAQMVMDGLRQAGDVRQAEYDAAEFRLTFTEDGKHAGLTNLHNLYEEFCKVPRSARQQQLRHVVRSLLAWKKETPTEFEDARHDLLPILRTRSYFEFVRLETQLKGEGQFDVPSQDLSEHLEISLVYDLPEAMKSISQEDLDNWGVTFYEALEAARENLEEREFQFAKIGDGLYASATADNYDAARLLMSNLIESLEVKGEKIALIPNRDTLLITGTEDDEGLEIMVKIAEEALEDPRRMNAIPIRLASDGWVSWRPAANHPLHEQFRLLEVKSLYPDYQQQKELLDALHEKDGIDIFVASYTASQNEDGRVMNYAVWSDGVDTLLPKAHTVIFFREGDEVVASADWDKVQQIVGHLMTPEADLYPARFHVTEFPTAEQLAAIGKLDL